jgi:hypothetical protein
MPFSMSGIKEEAVNFVVGYLKQDPDMPMRELQELAAQQGINVYPLIMGLAKNKIGLGRPKSPRIRKTLAARRVPPARNKSVPNLDDTTSLLNNFISHMKRLEQENQSRRSTLQRIGEMVRR